MTSVSNYNITKGDYGFALTFTMTDPTTGTALDLTNATITFKFKSSKGTGTATSQTCTINVAASGTCHYDLQATDTATADTYVWCLVAVYSGKTITSWGDAEINIINSI